MLNIRPVSDLRNNFAEISKIVHESGEPIILTKNGYADMIVWGAEEFELYQANLWQQEVVFKLKETEDRIKENPVWLTSDDVFGPIKSELQKMVSKDND